MAHQTKEAPSVKIDRPEVPDSLEAILTKMMAKKKDDRYQTARDIADALAQWLLENADAAWKKKNVNVVARIGGLSELSSTGMTPPKGVTSPRKEESDSSISPVRLTMGKTVPKKGKKKKGKKHKVAASDSSATLDSLQNKPEPVTPVVESEVSPTVSSDPFTAVKEKANIAVEPEVSEETELFPDTYTQKTLRSRIEASQWMKWTLIALGCGAIVLVGMAIYVFFINNT